MLGGGVRSNIRIVYSPLDVKSWGGDPLSVDAARPGSCPACGLASRPPGGGLGLHGHGLRTRQVRGPAEPGTAPVVGEVVGRRYLCRGCGAVLLVLPRGLLRGRLFTAGAIAYALALYGCLRRPPAAVRERVSPWQIVGAGSAGRWASLRRWVRAVRADRLFSGVRLAPQAWTARQLAERIATTLAAAAVGMEGTPIEHRAFAGAAM